MLALELASLPLAAPVLAMMGLGMQELMIIGIVAVLLFGKRLPEVAKSLGKSYNEFKRGLNDIQSEVDFSSSSTSSSKSDYSSSQSSSYSSSSEYEDDFEDHDEVTAPKFEAPASEPAEGADTVEPDAS